ncbi:MAG TPA: DUF3352 domain-containing protein [Pyrinomonadaceae bacterium]|nr:DUF3352 domain-containing protein [Pyrinomonadaceae bacterium]
MNILRRVSLLLIAFLLLAGSVAAQKRRGTPPKTPAQAPAQRPGPAFENVLAVDTYRVHVEIRGLGQLLKTPSFNDVIEPVMKVAGPPKEFKTLLTWLNSQADALIASRMMVASWAVRPNVPNVLLAIEFASPEEAQKFEPRLRNFLPKLLPTPTPSPSPGPETAPSANSPIEKKPATAPEPGENREAQVKEAGPSFVIKQAGSLVYVSDVAFTFKNLRPAGSKLLTEDPNFRRVHDRFETESVLVFVDTAGMQREDEERRRKLEEENLKLAQTQANEAPPNEGNEQEAKPLEEPQDEGPAPPEPSDPDVIALAEMNERQSQVELVNKNPQPPPPSPNIAGELLSRMASLFFSGPTTLPDAVGLALAFEPESYALRLLLVNEPSVKGNPIPFMPQLISGPPLTLEAAGVFPADTEFFVSLSLDYKQILDGMVKALEEQSQRVGMTPAAGEGEAESPFAVYERKAGLKLNEDLIPLLGNEVAVMLPLQTLDVGPSKVAAESTPGETEGASSKGAAPPLPNPVLAVAVRDRDGLRAVMPKVIESFGFKGASLLAQTEKRGDTEIVSYGGALSYAFVGNFLLLSTSSKEVSRVVDSYLNHDTLSSQSHFRNSTRWQPRQVLGQFYLSPKLMESYRDFARSMDSALTDQLGDLLSRLSPTSEPLTYALSNEGLGPMHELRLPKNLALLMVASMFGGSQATSASANESLAEGRLRAIFSAESTFRATNKDGKFGSIDQLIAANLVVKEFFEPSGYRLEVNALGSRFEATAVPVEYGKTGKLSFFMDESGVLRAGDHGGGPATVADKPVQ